LKVSFYHAGITQTGFCKTLFLHMYGSTRVEQVKKCSCVSMIPDDTIRQWHRKEYGFIARQTKK